VLSDDQLLRLRFGDPKPAIAGTDLERAIELPYEELAVSGRRFRLRHSLPPALRHVLRVIETVPQTEAVGGRRKTLVMSPADDSSAAARASEDQLALAVLGAV
jgi:hypothetical protein